MFNRRFINRLRGGGQQTYSVLEIHVDTARRRLRSVSKSGADLQR